MNPRSKTMLPIHPLEACVRPLEAKDSPTTPTRDPKGESGKIRVSRRVRVPSKSYSHDDPVMTMNIPAPAADTTMKSRSIPIRNSMKRTASELKLCEDEEMADFRDYIFFNRIIEGIARQHRATESNWFRRENDMCLAHIIGTRNGSQDDLPTSSSASSSTFHNKSYAFPSATTTSNQSASSHTRQESPPHHHHRYHGDNDRPAAGRDQDESERDDEIFMLEL